MGAKRPPDRSPVTPVVLFGSYSHYYLVIVIIVIVIVIVIILFVQIHIYNIYNKYTGK